MPIVLFRSYLPDPAQRAAEVAVGLVIIVLALRLLVRWRRGRFHAHAHEHDGVAHRHLHPHGHGPSHDGDGHHAHDHAPGRSPLQAYGIGLIHGVGGSAGVGVLLLAAIPDRVVGLLALALFALFTAVSMSLASTAFGYLITRGPARRRFEALAPVLGGLSLVFGAWYALGALGAVGYNL